MARSPGPLIALGSQDKLVSYGHDKHESFIPTCRISRAAVGRAEQVAQRYPGLYPAPPRAWPRRTVINHSSDRNSDIQVTLRLETSKTLNGLQAIPAALTSHHDGPGRHDSARVSLRRESESLSRHAGAGGSPWPAWGRAAAAGHLERFVQSPRRGLSLVTGPAGLSRDSGA